MAKQEDTISETNLRSVRELILDEQKLVTYVSLSKDLGVHVNESKILLHQIVKEIKENKSNTNLVVSFIISGLSSDKSAQTIVCLESELEAKKNAFRAIFFHHIYSVSLGLQCVDHAALASINKFEDFPLCAGLIKSDNCIKRSSDEIGKLKTHSQPTVNESKNITIKKENLNNLQNGHKESKPTVKLLETKSEPVVKTEDTSGKTNGASSVNGKHNTKNGIKPAKGIAGFFSKTAFLKSNTAPAKPTKTVQETKEEIKKEMEIKKVEIKKEIEIKEESMDIDEEEKVAKNIKKEPISSKKVYKNTSSLNKIKKNAKVDKKRKRVLHVSDSESDEENDPFTEKLDDPESDNEIPPTPTTNTVKITSGILNPKKKRKIVDKTYTDEEGYILTRKEEVYESCSDDENVNIVNHENIKKEPVEIQPKKEDTKQKNKPKTEVSPKGKGKATKKVSPPQKGKQGNIMNFFKKV